MSIFNRELLPDLASTTAAMTGEPEDARVENEPESRLQEILFSEALTSVCYWSMVLLLAIVGTGLVYWRLTHPGPSAKQRGARREANVSGECWRRRPVSLRSWA